MVAYEPFAGKFLQFFQFALEPRSNLRTYPRPWGEQTDHHMLIRALTDGSTEKGGIAFVEDIDDAVIIDGLAALAQVSTAGGAGSNFLRDRLAARRAEFHNQILRRTG
jgi:hypothetical protein